MSTASSTIAASVQAQFRAFFDELTNTVSYVVKHPGSSSCAVIDSVLDIDSAAALLEGDAERQRMADQAGID